MMSRPLKTGAHAREFFTARVERFGDCVRLVPAHGSQRRVIGRDGGVLFDYATANKLEAQVGDFLIVFGPTVAETLGARVMAINSNDSDRESFFRSADSIAVQLVAGELAATTTNVQVMKCAIGGTP